MPTQMAASKMAAAPPLSLLIGFKGYLSSGPAPLHQLAEKGGAA